MDNIVYLVWGGYFSNYTGEEGLEAIFTTKEKAIAFITENGSLKRDVNKYTKEPVDCWSDGDHYYSIEIGHLDSNFWFAPKENV